MLLLNYKDTPTAHPRRKWSDANKEAFLKAVREGKGLVVYPHRLERLRQTELGGVREGDRAAAGDRRVSTVRSIVFTVKKTAAKHPISEGLPAEFEHKIDELYQNSLMVPGNVVLATAYSDPSKPKGTGKDEAVIWVEHLRQGAGLQQCPGPRHRGPVRFQGPRLAAPRGHLGGHRQGGNESESFAVVKTG